MHTENRTGWLNGHKLTYIYEPQAKEGRFSLDGRKQYWGLWHRGWCLGWDGCYFLNIERVTEGAPPWIFRGVSLDPNVGGNDLHVTPRLAMNLPKEIQDIVGLSELMRASTETMRNIIALRDGEQLIELLGYCESLGAGMEEQQIQDQYRELARSCFWL